MPPAGPPNVAESWHSRPALPRRKRLSSHTGEAERPHRDPAPGPADRMPSHATCCTVGAELNPRAGLRGHGHDERRSGGANPETLAGHPRPVPARPGRTRLRRLLVAVARLRE